MDEKLEHYTSYFEDFFALDASTTDEFVLGNIKPAYLLFLESINLDKSYLETYLTSENYEYHYNIAKKMVAQFVNDVYKKSALLFVSKINLTVITVKYKKSTYVVKGEFVLRVINDFMQNKITLAGLTYEEFITFTLRNKPYWKDSLIEMQETVILTRSKEPLREYVFLLDRYETYDENFLNEIKIAAELFFK